MRDSASPCPAVLVMARFWQVGRVKTRLAATLGQAQAREIYRGMVEKLWQQLEHPQLQRHLWVSPAEQVEACGQWLPQADYLAAQAEGDLGQRMHQAFVHAANCPWAAVIGTDCPALSSVHILRAGAALEKADLAIHPTEDGGYALLALRQPTPELFQNIPWSTAKVLQCTLDRAAALGLRVAQLDTLRDLDDEEDWRQLCAQGLL